MIEQVGLKNILMLDTEFCNAYYQLKEILLESDDFWFIDNLKIFENESVNYHQDYKIKYKNFWLMLAEEKDSEKFGIVFVDIVED